MSYQAWLKQIPGTFFFSRYILKTLSLFLSKPWSGMAASHDRYMFKFLRNFPTAYQIACTIWCTQDQSRRVPIAPLPHQPLVWLVFLILNILEEMYLLVVLICIPLMHNYVEYLRVLICHPCIFFEDVSVQIICSLLNFYLWFSSESSVFNS